MVDEEMHQDHCCKVRWTASATNASGQRPDPNLVATASTSDASPVEQPLMSHLRSAAAADAAAQSDSTPVAGAGQKRTVAASSSSSPPAQVQREAEKSVASTRANEAPSGSASSKRLFLSQDPLVPPLQALVQQDLLKRHQVRLVTKMGKTMRILMRILLKLSKASKELIISCFLNQDKTWAHSILTGFPTDQGEGLAAQ